MNSKNIINIIDELCSNESYSEWMPSIDELHEVIRLMRSILFPGYFGGSKWTLENQKHYIGTTLDAVEKKLKEQVLRGYCFFCDKQKHGCTKCVNKASGVVDKFIETIPDIKRMLATDALAAYEGDPAAMSASETIFCYPSIRALTNH
ncbi:MAG: serine acetyltransferase, partial [Proteobacteria bacterium]|nr:serine acetyltransferase [Pseudomonadota bacterium]